MNTIKIFQSKITILVVMAIGCHNSGVREVSWKIPPASGSLLPAPPAVLDEVLLTNSSYRLLRSSTNNFYFLPSRLTVAGNASNPVAMVESPDGGHLDLVSGISFEQSSFAAAALYVKSHYNEAKLEILPASNIEISVLTNVPISMRDFRIRIISNSVPGNPFQAVLWLSVRGKSTVKDVKELLATEGAFLAELKFEYATQSPPNPASSAQSVVPIVIGSLKFN